MCGFTFGRTEIHCFMLSTVIPRLSAECIFKSSFFYTALIRGRRLFKTRGLKKLYIFSIQIISIYLHPHLHLYPHQDRLAGPTRTHLRYWTHLPWTNRFAVLRGLIIAVYGLERMHPKVRRLFEGSAKRYTLHLEI